MTNVHHTINYVEFQAADLEAIKAFYSKAFGWTFQDWGPTYISFAGAGLEGGFEKSDDTPMGGPLVILYSGDLAASEKAVVDAGGEVCRPVYGFPGGRRFHFKDPGGNELAIWTEEVE